MTTSSPCQQASAGIWPVFPCFCLPNKKLLVTSASLLVTSALLVVTRSYYLGVVKIDGLWSFKGRQTAFNTKSDRFLMRAKTVLES